jgi:Competence protein CoiA-like family
MENEDGFLAQRRDVLRAGDRALPEHDRFGEGDVRLAFGRHAATERIVHVKDVERGAACGCFCPACSEKLVARQGDALAWHFAHASGAQCRDALSAAMASWLRQCVLDGAEVVLPKWVFMWGHTRVDVPSPPVALKAERVVLEQEAPGHPFAVVCNTPSGHTVRLFPVCVPKPLLPTADACRDQVVPTVVIDMLPWLVGASRGGTWTPADMSQALCGTAPRVWLWSPRVDAARARHEQERLGALARSVLVPPPRPRVLDVPDWVHDLDVLQLPSLWAVQDGEGYLALPPKDWRLLFVWDMLICPLLTRPTLDPVLSTGFSGKEVGQWLRRRGLERVPYAVSKALGVDDRLEWGRKHPVWTPAYTIVDSWLRSLWSAGVLAAKPWKGTKASPNPGPFDSALLGADAPFWRASDALVRAVRQSVSGG